ncbi:MAG TPA: aldehyde dehydrogenase family protein [Pseudolabrys sp.]|nr:aldehyde dehydrogenase family protein [Pseudolabrys sp.]
MTSSSALKRADDASPTEIPMLIGGEWRTASETYEVCTGGVIINSSSTWRTDQLTYGGVKDSGIVREGPRYSIRDMTEQRMVLFNY